MVFSPKEDGILGRQIVYDRVVTIIRYQGMIPWLPIDLFYKLLGFLFTKNEKQRLLSFVDVFMSTFRKSFF